MGLLTSLYVITETPYISAAAVITKDGQQLGEYPGPVQRILVPLQLPG